MERTDYPAMLAALSPNQAVDVLTERVNHVGRLNAEVADWLAERRRLEESYANGLRRLARKQLHGMDLGIFSTPWSTLTTATDNQADSHASLAAKIDIDVERPLREFSRSSREMQAMSTMQGNLGALAKEVDVAQNKIDKYQSRGERADSSKVASANQELEQAQAQWESQAPYVFENLQALDEARLNHLRDVLTQLQTHEVDQVEKDRVSAEQCLNVLLNVEIADEIKTYALKAVANRPRNDRAVRQSTGMSASSNGPASQSIPNLAPTQSSASANEDASQRTGSIQEEEKKGPLKSLKRFSTVMGRKKDRSSKLPSQLEPMAEAVETKTKTSRFSTFGRKKKDALQLEDLPETSEPRRPYSPIRIGSEAFEPAEFTREQPAVHTTNGISAASAAAPAAAMEASQFNGDNHQNDLAVLEPPQAAPQAAPRQDSEGYSLPTQEIDPITRAQQEAFAAGGEGVAPQYNVNILSAPIAEEGNADNNAALADVASKLQMQAPPPQRRAGTVRGRRDNRNSAYITPTESPITPGFTRAKSSENISSMNSSIPELTPATSIAMPTPPPVRFDPSASTSSGISSLPPAQETSSPLKPLTRDNADSVGDAGSVRSGRSISKLSNATSATTGQPKHALPTGTGLNVSVIETVTASFDHGKNTGSSLIGELALVFIPPDFSSPFTHQTIRLDNVTKLDKIAPNPEFVSTTSSGRDGEYSVNLAAIGNTHQIAFKYQLHAEAAAEHAPLLLSPAFKIEPKQASIIVHYSLNPAFNLNGARSVTLSNVMLALTLEGAKATGCLSRPVGTFSRERNLIFWQLGDVTLTPGAAPEKLLARFATESQAEGGAVEARWEITGEHAVQLGSGVSISAQGQSASSGTDPFADDEAQNAWKTVESVKRLTSGNYTAR